MVREAIDIVIEDQKDYFQYEEERIRILEMITNLHTDMRKNIINMIINRKKVREYI